MTLVAMGLSVRLQYTTSLLLTPTPLPPPVLLLAPLPLLFLDRIADCSAAIFNKAWTSVKVNYDREKEKININILQYQNSKLLIKK